MTHYYINTDGNICKKLSSDHMVGFPMSKRQVLDELNQTAGHITFTFTPGAQELIAVTRQDDEGRIIKVLWQKYPPAQELPR